MSSNAPGWVTLTDGEAVVWSGGPSNVRVTEELFLEAVLIVAGIALVVAPVQQYLPAAVPDLGLYPLVLVGLGLLLVAVTYVRFRAIGYVLTSEELYAKRGLVSREVRTMRLDRVQDHGFEQSALQRVFGYGHVYVSTAGSSGIDLAFENVPNPDEVSGRLSEQLEAVRSRARAAPQA